MDQIKIEIRYDFDEFHGKWVCCELDKEIK